ncbi:helix-turn-helix transcriptional regulator [Streptomyces erythrochromogenes]|uniref:helix-turn-helix domain-containing protein n=1 Tax=Streptomyces erythrochromogenes TaxID=285574 RepID=UPI00332D6286
MDRDWARLGKALQAARRASGVTQEQLADELGVGRSAVQLIERGKEFSKPSQTQRAFARRVGWADGSIEAVLAGGEPTVEAAATPPPAPDDVLTDSRLPLRIVDELADDGALLDTTVVPLGDDARMVVVVKGKPGASAAELRRDLEKWRAAYQHLLEAVEVERGGEDDPAANQA